VLFSSRYSSPLPRVLETVEELQQQINDILAQVAQLQQEPVEGLVTPSEVPAPSTTAPIAETSTIPSDADAPPTPPAPGDNPPVIEAPVYSSSNGSRCLAGAGYFCRSPDRKNSSHTPRGVFV
jgi:hypothetical protein